MLTPVMLFRSFFGSTGGAAVSGVVDAEPPFPAAAIGGRLPTGENNGMTDRSSRNVLMSLPMLDVMPAMLTKPDAEAID